MKTTETIPSGKLCDSGCGQDANFFSPTTGRYRCAKSANTCPANRKKNSDGLKVAHADGRVTSFSSADRRKSQIRHRQKLVATKPFDQLGHTLRKKIVMEDQDYKCLHCNLSEWMGLRITLELDHIDGNRNNQVRENLRCLCPNCHSITDTWKRGQAGKRIATDCAIINSYAKTGTISATLKELNMNWGSADTVRKVLFKYNIIDSV